MTGYYNAMLTTYRRARGSPRAGELVALLSHVTCAGALIAHCHHTNMNINTSRCCTRVGELIDTTSAMLLMRLAVFATGLGSRGLDVDDEELRRFRCLVAWLILALLLMMLLMMRLLLLLLLLMTMVLIIRG